MAGEPRDELLTIEEVAEWLKVPVATVRRWRVFGDGPAGFKVGRYVRYKRSTVEAWLKSQEDKEFA